MRRERLGGHHSPDHEAPKKGRHTTNPLCHAPGLGDKKGIPGKDAFFVILSWNKGQLLETRCRRRQSYDPAEPNIEILGRGANDWPNRIATTHPDSALLAHLIADHPANGRATHGTQYATVGHHRTGHPAYPRTDHRAFLTGRHAVPGRTTGRRKGEHKNDNTRSDLHLGLLFHLVRKR